VVNGLMDPPFLPLKRRQTSPPRQVGPEGRYLLIYGLTRRDYGSLSLIARDVAFSTQGHTGMVLASAGVQHQFTPLVQGQLELGAALTREWLRLASGSAPPTALSPTVDAILKAPVPLGRHWPVKARLRARYLPAVDPYTTRLYPRGDVGLTLKWAGRKEAAVEGELRHVRSLARTGFLTFEQQTEASLKVLWPLPLHRSTFLSAEGRFARLHRRVISDFPLYQWFADVGLVLRPRRGRL
jgi:hypothetical protein